MEINRDYVYELTLPKKFIYAVLQRGILVVMSQKGIKRPVERDIDFSGPIKLHFNSTEGFKDGRFGYTEPPCMFNNLAEKKT